MFTTLQSFVIQKMKQGIYPFRLTADTMNRLYKITPIMYYFIKETRFRKSILQIRIKNFISILPFYFTNYYNKEDALSNGKLHPRGCSFHL